MPQTPMWSAIALTPASPLILETRYREIQQKSCFIIASNQLEEAQLSHEAMLDYYTPGQQKVERGFRFLKDSWFMANTLFLKSPKRIMALMMIMTLCLLIYGALEYRSFLSYKQTCSDENELLSNPLTPSILLGLKQVCSCLRLSIFYCFYRTFFEHGKTFFSSNNAIFCTNLFD